MKLNPHILSTTIALITSVAFATELEKPSQTTITTANGGSKASASVVGGKGKATVTIDVNGKKETREIDLGNGTEIKVITGNEEGGGPSTVASVAKVNTPPKMMTWLGVATGDASEELRAQLPLEPGSGLVVNMLMAESPAAKAGLQKNDVLVKFDDQLLTNASQLRTLITGKREGDMVKLTYFRRGQLNTAEVKIGMHEDKPVPGLQTNADWVKRLSNLGNEFQIRAKTVVVDRDGEVVVGNPPDMSEIVEKVRKALRDVGVDEKSVDEATRALRETTNAIRGALRDATVAKEEAMKGSGEVAKALEQVRDALEKVRQQAEEAVKKDRENRRSGK